MHLGAMKKPKRLIIQPHDVCVIMGKSKRQAQRLLQTIRDALGKAPHQPVSVKEFAEYMALDLEDVEGVVG